MGFSQIVIFLGAGLALQACSFNMSVPDHYQADNTQGCSVSVEDARSKPRTVSFGRSELVSDPVLSEVLQREACSREGLRSKDVTIHITSAFCDTQEWAIDAYAEVHARAWLPNEELPIRAMRTAKGTAEGPAPAICGDLLWPLAAEIMDDIEAKI
jgi:hypothetical protein